MKETAQLCMVGCSHRHSSLPVRERLAFSPSQATEALQAWRSTFPDTEAVLLSTCNRVEFYTASEAGAEQIHPKALIQHLAHCHDLPVEKIQGELLAIYNQDVVEHLFRVSASLDSMVVGESQILSQVKQAYELAGEAGSAGPVVHSFFQAALRVARRVSSETSLHRHRVSIPSVAIADFAGCIFERFDDKRVLVIGAGEMAQETLRYLIDAGARQITVLNRDFSRAEQLAAEHRGMAAPWDELVNQLVESDLVVSTTGADQPIVSLELFQKQIVPHRHQRTLFVLDLAVPRDFEPAIGDELGVYLYGIDDLSEACERNRIARTQELPAANRIIEEETQRYIVHARHRASAPVIAQFRAGLESVQADELARLFQKLPELDERSKREINQFADRLLGKLIHPPLESLRDESKNGSPHRLLEALQRLFQLK